MSSVSHCPSFSGGPPAGGPSALRATSPCPSPAPSPPSASSSCPSPASATAPRQQLAALLWQYKGVGAASVIINLLKPLALSPENVLLMSAALIGRNEGDDREKAKNLLTSFFPQPENNPDAQKVYRLLECPQATLSFDFLAPPEKPFELALADLSFEIGSQIWSTDGPFAIGLLKLSLDLREKYRLPNIYSCVSSLVYALRHSNNPPPTPGAAGEWEECLELLEKWTWVDPAQASLWNFQGILNSLRGKLDASGDTFDPAHFFITKIRTMLGCGVSQYGNFDKAILLLEPLVKGNIKPHDRENQEATLVYAHCLALRQRTGDRIAAYKLAQLWSTCAVLPDELKMRWKQLYEQMEENVSIPLISPVSFKPSRESIAFWAGCLGRLLWNTPQAPLAIKMLDLAISLHREVDATSAPWINTLAHAHRKQGNLLTAVSHFNRLKDTPFAAQYHVSDWLNHPVSSPSSSASSKIDPPSSPFLSPPPNVSLGALANDLWFLEGPREADFIIHLFLRAFTDPHLVQTVDSKRWATILAYALALRNKPNDRKAAADLAAIWIPLTSDRERAGFETLKAQLESQADPALSIAAPQPIVRETLLQSVAQRLGELGLAPSEPVDNRILFLMKALKYGRDNPLSSQWLEALVDELLKRKNPGDLDTARHFLNQFHKSAASIGLLESRVKEATDATLGEFRAAWPDRLEDFMALPS